jgi:phosphate transport system substrate-binding protein
MISLTFRAVLCAAALVAGVPAALARDQIRIVGSSTVFPFSTEVAEAFGKQQGRKVPIVESTGTGGGFKLFCTGLGVQYPDISNASRRITASELAECGKNGVSVSEVKFGYDGIVFVSANAGPAINFTREQLWKAIARQVPVNGQMVANPYRKWRQIDSSLPDTDIVIFGPAANHGTRDAMVELVLDEGCRNVAEVKAIADAKARAAACRTVREDGAWIDVADAYTVTVDRTLKAPGSVGIIGFGFYDSNKARLKAATINGVEATLDTIASGKYQVSRALFFYVKREHVGVVPGLKEFVAEFTSARVSGDKGSLVDKGLIPLPKPELDKVRSDAEAMSKLEGLGS